MNSTAPRHYPNRAALVGVGTPHDRQARLAARRAFVSLKQSYLLAIDSMAGARAEWLRFQVRHAEEPADLWLLRAAVFESLPARECRAERERLQRGIDSLFPNGGSNSGFATLY